MPHARNESYSGPATYRLVEPILRKGKRIMVVSPYIDSYYAEFILRHSRGKRIRIIASSMDKRALNMLSRGKRSMLPMLYSVCMAFITFLTINSDFYRLWPLPAAALAVSAMLSVRGAHGNDIIVRIPKRFTHAKMYINEECAANGSANLTYQGMHMNIEHIELIRNHGQRGELEREFWELWRKA